MEFREVIYGRRSVRKYLSKGVPDEVLEEILDCAMQAPSGVNLQPWYYVVIRSREKRESFLSLMRQVAEKNCAHLEERFAKHPEVVKETLSFISSLGDAPVFVLAFRNQPDYSYALQDEGIVQSIAASMENLILSAYDHGLASCWLTAPAQAHMCGEIRDLFAQGHGELLCIATIGYADPAVSVKTPARKSDRYVII